MCGHGGTTEFPRVQRGLIITRDHSVARSRVLACLVVTVCSAVFLVYLPALSAEAMLLDDTQYISENPLIQNPSWGAVRRFFFEIWRPSTVRGYYQPLTMISLMADRCLAGTPDDLSVYHRTNLLLHIGNTSLLAMLIYLLFGEPIVAVG